MHSLLPKGRYARWTFITFVSIFMVLTYSYRHDDDLSEMASLAGLLPIIAFVTYAAVLALFTHRFGRRPKDVLFNFETGLFWDRCFAFAVTAGLLIPSVLMLNYIAG